MSNSLIWDRISRQVMPLTEYIAYMYSNYGPPRVAMFGVQRGEGAVQFARRGHELM